MVATARVSALASIKWQTLFIRLELPLWVLLGFPPLLPILPILFVVSPVVGFAVLVLGTLFDGTRRILSVSREAIPKNVVNSLNMAIGDLRTRGGLPATAQRLRVVPGDLSLAAHVNGVFLPRVVMSGGLLVGLLKRNATARAILAHELAHIKHYDRVLPSLIVIVLINSVLGLGMVLLYGLMKNPMGLHSLTNPAVTIAMLGFVSRRREYAADAHALTVLGSQYIETLCSHASSPKKWSFFHPSIQQRIYALLTGCPVLGPSMFWLGVWLVYVLLGINKIASVSSFEFDFGFDEVQGISMCLLGFFGILMELGKFMLRCVYPPIIYAGEGWGSWLKKGNIYAKGNRQENSVAGDTGVHQWYIREPWCIREPLQDHFAVRHPEPDRDFPLECPDCGLFSPPTAMRCDCGYTF